MYIDHEAIPAFCLSISATHGFLGRLSSRNIILIISDGIKVDQFYNESVQCLFTHSYFNFA